MEQSERSVSNVRQSDIIMYQLDRTKQTITIEGKTYSSDIFLGENLPESVSHSEFHNDLLLFLNDWFSDSPTIKVQTSGSTGIPKEMFVEKSKMMQSAQLTCSFLGLKKGDSALLCMSLDYIAGKMVAVRALVAELDLYPVLPSGNPLKNIHKEFSFAAMIPLQVFNSLQSDTEKKRLSNIKNLIIGGGSIDPQIEEAVKDFPHKVYSTYGMTETLSHIALRRLNGKEASDHYYPFDSVTLSLSEDNALIIDAPLVSNERLYTNDIVEIYEDKSFRIIGRKDNIINSGGVKIQIEEIEALLRPALKNGFAITSLPDPKFGEIVVLATEKEIDKNIISNLLPVYFIPKKIIKVSKIPLTETGKINRAALKQLVLSELRNPK
ncbi:O-succinylbenzoic acid--CoA ligase [Dysgonomonas alginatilytica]|uniref:O-succinylbenzoic acid--CoA ligase n=2 Tax=Dysgonomonas alginatilytica TaxID=1605892 RepID=A0A2V3PMM6_9BACT|nr:O-succinylbenzoic acid--CoA ligase [Dysgonomonas alginatilytica]